MSRSTMEHFSPFANSTWQVLSLLSMGLEGKGAVTIRASHRGLTAKMAGGMIARGKDARELCADIDRVLAARLADLAALKTRVDRLEESLPKT